MQLDKTQFQQTQAAILRAFDRDALRKMLRRELSEDLDVVAGDDKLDTVVFDLVTWAERNGRTETARLLAQKAVVLLEPVERLGAIIWP